MVFRKRILSIATVLVMGASPALFAQTKAASPTSSANKAAEKSKPAAPKEQVLKGSLVVINEDQMTVRAGKKDMNFKVDSTTTKPSSMTPGANVTVHYHNEGTQHIATSIQLAPTASNATAAKPPARK